FGKPEGGNSQGGNGGNPFDNNVGNGEGASSGSGGAGGGNRSAVVGGVTAGVAFVVIGGLAAGYRVRKGRQGQSLSSLSGGVGGGGAGGYGGGGGGDGERDGTILRGMKLTDPEMAGGGPVSLTPLPRSLTPGSGSDGRYYGSTARGPPAPALMPISNEASKGFSASFDRYLSTWSDPARYTLFDPPPTGVAAASAVPVMPAAAFSQQRQVPQQQSSAYVDKDVARMMGYEDEAGISPRSPHEHQWSPEPRDTMYTAQTESSYGPVLRRLETYTSMAETELATPTDDGSPRRINYHDSLMTDLDDTHLPPRNNSS
ncbi:hypothetical protein HK104_008068, partial [Borealophlyctis nickersoniae]